jgi:hypothetical protein
LTVPTAAEYWFVRTNPLRDAAGKTQINVARESEMDQGDISRLETRSNFDDCQVITLRRYVEALGGSLEWSLGSVTSAS